MEPETDVMKIYQFDQLNKISLQLTVHFFIMRYKRMETNPYACLTGTPAVHLEERY